MKTVGHLHYPRCANQPPSVDEGNYVFNYHVPHIMLIAVSSFSGGQQPPKALGKLLGGVRGAATLACSQLSVASYMFLPSRLNNYQDYGSMFLIYSYSGSYSIRYLKCTSKLIFGHYLGHYSTVFRIRTVVKLSTNWQGGLGGPKDFRSAVRGQACS